MFSFADTLIKRLSEKTGFPVTVGSLKGNPLRGRFDLTDLQIRNPDPFPLKDFLSVVEARVRFSPGSLLGRNLQVRELWLHLRQLTGIRAKSGAVNIEQFREALERREPGENSGRKGVSRRTIHIARLAVRVDHVATVDFVEAGGNRRDYPIGFDREFQDVRDLLLLGPPLVEHCGAAGLCRVGDAIFGTLLPVLLWEKIELATRFAAADSVSRRR